MEELLALLKDGHARSVELLAMELNTDVEDVKRKIEYLENTGIIRRVNLTCSGCKSCTGCPSKSPSSKVSTADERSAGASSAPPCKGCLPDGGFKNMGEMWEVVS